MNLEELESELKYANEKIENLKGQVNRLENIVRYSKLPKTNILSDKFLTRAFAILGHYAIASLIIFVPIYALLFIIIILINVGTH